MLAQRQNGTATDNGITITANDGTYIIDGTPTNIAVAYAFDSAIYLPPGSYSVSYFNDAVTAPGLSVYLMSEAGSVLVNHSLNTSNKTASFTISQAVTKLRIRGKPEQRLDAVKLSPMVVSGATAPRTFEKYKYKTASASVTETVYGGRLDLVTGVLTTTMVIKDMGDIAWGKSSSPSASGGSVFAYNGANLNPAIKPRERYTASNIYCTSYKTAPSTSWFYTSLQNGEISINTNSIAIAEDAYTDAQAFKTAVTGQKVVYEIATPTYSQLTHQQISAFRGANHIWADSGNVSVTYRA